MTQNSIFCGLFLGLAILAVTGVVLAQNVPPKKNGGSSSGAAVARGKTLFQSRCALCHYAESDSKKIGPGLKGISKRRTFSKNGNKITDESLKNWIENGDELMPPFKDALEPAQVRDVMAYVKTL